MRILPCLGLLCCLFFLGAVCRAEAVFDVTALGAAPDDAKDDTGAIQTAFTKACAQPGSRVVLPKGVYRIRGPLNIKGARGLTIEGQDAELLLGTFTKGLVFDDCRQVTVRGLSIDMDPLPWFVGKVVARADDEKQFELQLDPGYHIVPGARVQIFTEYDRATRLPHRSTIDWYYKIQAAEPVDAQTWRFKLIRPLNLPAVGGTLLMRYAADVDLIYVSNSADFTFQDMNLYAADGYGLHCFMSRNFLLQRFNTRLRSGRWLSVNADATHFRDCSGEVTLEDCLLEGEGDDGTNIHTQYNHITEIVDPTTIKIAGRGWANLHDDDVLEFAKGDLLPYATIPMTGQTIDRQTKVSTVTLAQMLPADAAVGDWLAAVSQAPKVRIRHCLLRGNRGRGLKIQTRDVVIEDCTFDRCCAAGILVMCDLSGNSSEALGSREVTIRDCVFLGCNYGVARRAADLDVLADQADGKPAPAGVLRNITIEGCTFAHAFRDAIHVSSARGVTIRDNHILSCCEQAAPAGTAAIALDHVDDITLGGNTFGTLGLAKEAILQGEGCKQVKVE